MNPKYKIITSASPHRLEDLVNQEIKHGWIPSGNPVAADIDHCGRDEWMQAMTKGI